MTALMFAAEYGHVAIVEKLLKHDYKNLLDPQLRFQREPVDVNMSNNDQYTALILAAARGHTEVVRLIANAPDTQVGKKNKYGVNALMAAAKKGSLECVKILCQWTEKGEKGFAFRVDDVSYRGRTALMLASREGHIDIVRYLCEKAHANAAKVSGSKSVRAT
jgi:ankyrin repeat protein